MPEREKIYSAEEARVYGGYAEAISMARTIADIPTEQIPGLSTEELEDKMRAWRIWVDTLGKLFNRAWNGNRAAEYLAESREVILRFYDHQIVKAVARNMSRDAEGHEYFMASEMARDRGKHWIKLASLSGKPAYLRPATQEFAVAVNLAEQNTSARALAEMERAIVERGVGKNMDWKLFRNSYLILVYLAGSAGNWDRQAAASWWFTQEALRARRVNDVRLGIENLREAASSLDSKRALKIFLPILVGKPLETSRKITYSGDPRELELRA